VFCSFRVLAEIGNPARLLARVSADGADAGSPEKRPGALPALDVPLPFPVESGFVSVELRHRYSPPGLLRKDCAVRSFSRCCRALTPAKRFCAGEGGRLLDVGALPETCLNREGAGWIGDVSSWLSGVIHYTRLSRK
jgi:hypothetical protein